MSLIGLLASTEKMVPEGCLHMRPFQFHLKEHWRYPQSLDSFHPWTETFSAHLEWWQNPKNSKIRTLLGLDSCTVRLFISLIDLLTVTETQVPSGCIHMQPIQWHLKANWYVPEFLEKRITHSKISTQTPTVVA